MRTMHALAASLTLSLACSSAVPAQGSPIDATVSMIREAGVALTSWSIERSGGNPTILDRTATRTTFDWKACPAITRARAQRLLATDQSAKLPENDGWGHAIEYCLHTTETAASGHLVGVRSPGRDGRFDGTSYAPAGFDPAHSDHDDIVWIDGVFVTWPESR